MAFTFPGTYHTQDMLFGFSLPSRSLGNLSLSDALYVTDIFSAGQMIFHAHIQSAIFILGIWDVVLGCGSASFSAC